jgi:hypothetical protein
MSPVALPGSILVPAKCSSSTLTKPRSHASAFPGHCCPTAAYTRGESEEGTVKSSASSSAAPCLDGPATAASCSHRACHPPHPTHPARVSTPAPRPPTIPASHAAGAMPRAHPARRCLQRARASPASPASPSIRPSPASPLRMPTHSSRANTSPSSSRRPPGAPGAPTR